MKENQNYVYGIHSVETLLRQTPENIRIIYIQMGTEGRLRQLIKLSQLEQISIQYVSRNKLDVMSSQANHQGVIAERIKQRAITSLEELLNNLHEPAFLLILDGVQDPHNLGACLRSANAAGVHAVIAPKDRAVGLTPVVRKVASGAAEITPFIQVTNLAQTFEKLKEKNIWLYGTAEEATENLFATDLTGSIALVLGAEGEGLRRLTKERCDKLICIPTVGEISSLNVSVAAGVCLFEAFRQRHRVSGKL
jgi:23S rRNA (guanosine2251-2'-O)-methyltransferase